MLEPKEVQIHLIKHTGLGFQNNMWPLVLADVRLNCDILNLKLCPDKMVKNPFIFVFKNNHDTIK
jgi:hypothetical protein